MTRKDITPREYLNEYYFETDLETEGGFLMKFFHETYNQLTTGPRVLEVGGGPTIYQLISAIAKAQSIAFSDYSEDNLTEVKKWLKDKSDAFNWDDYFKIALILEGKQITKENLDRIKERLRNKVTATVKCDIFKKNPLAPLRFGAFDVVSTNFCPEAITSTEEDFRKVMINLSSLLKKDGMLVMTLARNGHYYQVSELRFHGYAMDEGYIKRFLEGLGFRHIKLESISVNYNDGYDGIIALTAINAQ